MLQQHMAFFDDEAFWAASVMAPGGTVRKKFVDIATPLRSKYFTRQQMWHYTRQEVCGSLERAISIGSGETEGQWLSDRLEPWIGLARDMSHNVATRIYYWPDLHI